MADHPVKGETSGSSASGLDRSARMAAVSLAVVFGMVQVGAVTWFPPLLDGMYRDMGAKVPPFMALLVDLGSSRLLIPLLVAVDAGVFAVFYRLAQGRWVGLLFAPAAVYFVSTGLLLLALYVPMYSAVEFVP